MLKKAKQMFSKRQSSNWLAVRQAVNANAIVLTKQNPLNYTQIEKYIIWPVKTIRRNTITF